MKKRRKSMKIKPYLVSPEDTTSNVPRAGDIIWYPASKKSFVRTTLDWMKRWFK